MTEREKLRIYILDLRENKRLSFGKIGKLLNISRQRVYQIYKKPERSPATYLLLEKEKISTLKLIEIYGENPNKNGISGGLDYIREWARIRDRHTCQICFKKWEKGKRRLDVHHLDENRESTRDIKWDKENLHRLITLCHKCHLSLDSVQKKIQKHWDNK